MFVPMSLSRVFGAALFLVVFCAACVPDPVSEPSGEPLASVGNAEEPIEEQVLNDVKQALKSLDETGELNEEALSALAAAKNGNDLRTRALVGAFVRPAVEKGAMTKEEGLKHLQDMQAKAPTEDEQKMFSAMAETLTGNS
jgi:hypothetical protein